MKKLISFLIATMFATGVFAQNDATLEETVEFIKLKTMDKRLWYTTSSKCTGSHCSFLTHYYGSFATMELKNKTFEFTNDCSETKCFCFWKKLRTFKYLMKI